MTPHGFHPDLARSAAVLPRGIARAWLLPLLRGGFSLAGALGGGGATRVPLRGCAAYVFRPAAASAGPRPGLLWLHGGGLILGDARQEAALLRHVAERLGVVVVSAQYHLAPEHPFPTPLHDCAQVWRWMTQQPDLDPARLAVCGVSAGGGLAAALCHLLRDEGGPHPRLQALLYPMLDDRSAHGSGPEDRHHRLWDRAANRLGWDSYLRGCDRDALPLYAVPGRATDLSGLPPAWLGVGTLDLFLAEDLRYADALEAAGVAVQRQVVPGAYHGFDAADPTAGVSRAFRAAWMAAIAAALAP